MTVEGKVSPADVGAARQAGVSDAAIRDALWVCSLFNIINRVADALGFQLLDEQGRQPGPGAVAARVPVPGAGGRPRTVLPQRPATRALR